VGPEEITAIVLCGGSGARLGGVDKPMLQLGDARLIDHVVAALAPQVGTIMISCGREAARYEALGLATVADVRPGDGPLGGIVSALPHVETDWVLTHPGDAPFAHPSLVERLAPSAEAGGIAVPRAGSHRQNLTLLMSRARADSLARFYGRGGRAVKAWLDEQRVESVDMTEIADSFFNINTAADLETAARRMVDHR
jgi:molybdopterin-guanine dinucleotide biosynthesis protein A